MKKNYNKNFIKSSVLFVSILVFVGNTAWADDPAPKIDICTDPTGLKSELKLSIKQMVPDTSKDPFSLNFSEKYACIPFTLDNAILGNEKTEHWIMLNQINVFKKIVIPNVKNLAKDDCAITIKYNVATYNTGEILLTGGSVFCSKSGMTYEIPATDM
jgi:hypothetical protein